MWGAGWTDQKMTWEGCSNITVTDGAGRPRLALQDVMERRCRSVSVISKEVMKIHQVGNREMFGDLVEQSIL